MLIETQAKLQHKTKLYDGTVTFMGLFIGQIVSYALWSNVFNTKEMCELDTGMNKCWQNV